jgi:hypothetical protein
VSGGKKRLLMLEANGHACKFMDAPAGLFMFEGRLGIKLKNGDGYIEPGELFMGHKPYREFPSELAVQPVRHKWEACVEVVAEDREQEKVVAVMTDLKEDPT